MTTPNQCHITLEHSLRPRGWPFIQFQPVEFLIIFSSLVKCFCLQFFWLVTDSYKEGTPKEMKKWSYEIYSTFLAERAVCIVFCFAFLHVLQSSF